jgi:hypothetical protein
VSKKNINIDLTEMVVTRKDVTGSYPMATHPFVTYDISSFMSLVNQEITAEVKSLALILNVPDSNPCTSRRLLLSLLRFTSHFHILK